MYVRKERREELLPKRHDHMCTSDRRGEVLPTGPDERCLSERRGNELPKSEGGSCRALPREEQGRVLVTATRGEERRQ